MGFGALLVFYEDAARYAVLDYDVHRGTLPLGFPAVLIASELWSVMFLMPPLIILLFPDGTLPPRWLMVARAYLAVCALIIASLVGGGALLLRGTRIVVQGNGQIVGNSGPAGALGFVVLIGFLAVPVFWVRSSPVRCSAGGGPPGSAGSSSSGSWQAAPPPSSA